LLLAAVGCQGGHDAPPVAEPTADVEATASASSAALRSSDTPANATASTTTKATSKGKVVPRAPVRCLTPAEIEMEIKGKTPTYPLAVIEVGPGDSLNLREKPGAWEPVVGTLAYDLRGVRATAKVCRVGKSTWYECTVKSVGVKQRPGDTALGVLHKRCRDDDAVGGE